MGARRFAGTSRAIGLCDVCGFRYKLNQLRANVVRGVITEIRACPECWDEDHPQNMLGRYPVDDPQALENPRSDIAERAASRAAPS